MSTELSNGVIIPEEYSDDWYDEMSINLRKLNDVITAASDNATDIQRLDTDKANQSDLTALTSRVSQNETDIIALQTAVSGALKREIVQTLPTEDISTTTIYMIRNSQSSGTNIYDEYMYINNLWELIGTSATDFSNYYTKTESDNLLSAKANQTDLTALTSRVSQNETDIIALQTAVSGALKREIVQILPTEDISTTTIYMIRNSQSSGTNIYDEYMYINSQWELIGTSATDFSNYYTKTESDNLLTAKANQTDLTSLSGRVTQTETDITALQTAVSGALKREIVQSLPTQDISTTTIYMIRNTTTSGDNIYDEYMYINNLWELIGTSATDFSNYYTKNEIDTLLSGKANDSDVVHKSGDETIAGLKTFENNKMVVGTNTNSNSVIQFVNSDVVGDSANGASGFEVYGSSVSNANKIGGITIGEFSNNGGSYASIECNRTASGVKTSNTIRSLIRPDGSKELSATTDNDCKLGSKFLRWSDVHTYKINSVELSSLSLPGSRDSRVDISSYFTDTSNGGVNRYTAPSNGFVYLAVNDVVTIHLFSQDLGRATNYGDTRGRATAGLLYAFLPVRKGDVFTSQWYTTLTNVSLTSAYFIPCQGNV